MGFEKNITKAAPLDAPTPKKGQSVTVHCTGIVQATGKKFWSTKDAGQKPFTFTIGLGQVIKGWDEGVMGMQLGESADLTCTPDYGYGAAGFPAWGIPPNAVLIFQIEVLSIK